MYFYLLYKLSNCGWSVSFGHCGRLVIAEKLCPIQLMVWNQLFFWLKITYLTIWWWRLLLLMVLGLRHATGDITYDLVGVLSMIAHWWAGFLGALHATLLTLMSTPTFALPSPPLWESTRNVEGFKSFLTFCVSVNIPLQRSSWIFQPAWDILVGHSHLLLLFDGRNGVILL